MWLLEKRASLKTFNHKRLCVLFRFVSLTFLSFFCLCLASVQGVLLDEVDEAAQVSLFENKRVGYYVGSFDPFHKGHEDVIQQALDGGLVDLVIIMPAWGGDDYKKRTDIKKRLLMLEKVYRSHPRVVVTRFSPKELQDKLTEPDEGRKVLGKPTVKPLYGVEFIGLIGSDVALSLSQSAAKEPKKDALKPSKAQKWLLSFMSGIRVPETYERHTIGGIMAVPVAKFIVVMREGDNLEALAGKLGDREIIAVLESRYPDASSTRVRQVIQNQTSIDNLVPSEVADIIEAQKLYQEK